MEWVVVGDQPPRVEERFKLPTDECPFPWGAGVAIMNPETGIPTAFYNTGLVDEIRQDPLPTGGAYKYELTRLNGSTLVIQTDDYRGLEPYGAGLGRNDAFKTKYVTVTCPAGPGARYRRVLLIARLEAIRALVELKDRYT